MLLFLAASEEVGTNFVVLTDVNRASVEVVAIAVLHTANALLQVGMRAPGFGIATVN